MSETKTVELDTRVTLVLALYCRYLMERFESGDTIFHVPGFDQPVLAFDPEWRAEWASLLRETADLLIT